MFNRNKPAPRDSEVGRIVNDLLHASFFTGYRTDSGYHYRTLQKNTTEAGVIETRDDTIYLFQKVDMEISNVFPAWGAWDHLSRNVYLFSRIRGDITIVREGFALQGVEPAIPIFDKKSFLSYIDNLNV
ncbi:hypothetical protein 035JT004_45 [Bacillus phage 035JT004]|nr:hypothetical protein 035JT004_45 [Bacillus phage 035JT004]